MAKATRVRFWIWWKGSPVKLTIVGEQEIEMGHSEPTEEGFASWYEKYWVEDGYLSSDAEDVKLAELNTSGARLLLVAKGVPAQERWIAAHAARLTVPVILGVGALFDFYSGTVPRAPPLVRKLRMEWAYRLLQEPRRLFRRYVLGNPEFIARALLWRLFH